MAKLAAPRAGPRVLGHLWITEKDTAKFGWLQFVEISSRKRLAGGVCATALGIFCGLALLLNSALARQWAAPAPGAGDGGARPAASELAKRLVAVRDQAILQQDWESLATLSAPGSAAAKADEAMIDSVGKRPVSRLHTRVVDAVWIDERKLKVNTVQAELIFANGGNEGTSASRCALWTLDSQWRIETTEPCTAEG